MTGRAQQGHRLLGREETPLLGHVVTEGLSVSESSPAFVKHTQMWSPETRPRSPAPANKSWQLSHCSVTGQATIWHTAHLCWGWAGEWLAAPSPPLWHRCRAWRGPGPAFAAPKGRWPNPMHEVLPAGHHLALATSFLRLLLGVEGTVGTRPVPGRLPLGSAMAASPSLGAAAGPSGIAAPAWPGSSEGSGCSLLRNNAVLLYGTRLYIKTIISNISGLIVKL